MLRSGKPVVARLGENVVLVSLPENFDGESIPNARHALTSVGAHGAGYVIIDLAAVSLLDPATLSLLVGWADDLSRDGGQVVIASNDPRVARQFAITRFERVVRLERTLMEAVDALAVAAPPVGAP